MGCCKSTDRAELACVPSAIAASERSQHFSLARQLLRELAEERQELANGYAWRFRASLFQAIARFVANERKCCPFASFELTIAPAEGPIWLRLTGPEGTREVLQAELGLPGSCGCD
jgi:hypothetical protein